MVNHITKGLCSILDVAVAFLKLTEAATRWVGKAINFLLTAFRVKRYFRFIAICFYFYVTILPLQIHLTGG